MEAAREDILIIAALWQPIPVLSWAAFLSRGRNACENKSLF